MSSPAENTVQTETSGWPWVLSTCFRGIQLSSACSHGENYCLPPGQLSGWQSLSSGKEYKCYFSPSLKCVFFLNRISFISASPQTCYVVEDDTELPVLLSSSQTCWNPTCVPQHLVCAMLKSKSRVLCIPSNQPDYHLKYNPAVFKNSWQMEIVSI